jgi:hypothetical protein
MRQGEEAGQDWAAQGFERLVLPPALAAAVTVLFRKGDGCPLSELDVFRGLRQPPKFGDWLQEPLLHATAAAGPFLQSKGSMLALERFQWQSSMYGQLLWEVVQPEVEAWSVEGDFGVGGKLSGLVFLEEGSWTFEGSCKRAEDAVDGFCRFASSFACSISPRHFQVRVGCRECVLRLVSARSRD